MRKTLFQLLQHGGWEFGRLVFNPVDRAGRSPTRSLELRVAWRTWLDFRDQASLPLLPPSTPPSAADRYWELPPQGAQEPYAVRKP